MISENYTVVSCRLNVGSKFVLPSYSEECPYVYVVTGQSFSDGSIDCVCINSGKEFTFGGSVPVVPVSIEISRIVVEEM